MRSILLALILACVPALSQTANGTAPILPILIDLSATAVTPTTITDAITRFLSRTPGMVNVVGTPTLYDTGGNIFTALQQLRTILSAPNAPIVVAIADVSVEVTVAVLNTMKASLSAIPVVSLFVADATACDVTAFPNVVCIAPQELTNLQAAFDLGYNSFQWRSVAVVVSNSMYGRGLLDALRSEESTTAVRPIVVARELMGLSAADDDALLRRLTQNSPTVIIAFVTSDEALRLQAAQARLRISGLFWVWSKTATSILSSLRGNVVTREPMTGALLVPQFALPDELVSRNIIASASTVDPLVAALLSFLFDTLQLVYQNGAGATAASIRGQTLSNPAPFTGTNVSFDSITGERTFVTFRMISAVYQTTPLAQWSRIYVSSTPTSVIASFAPSLIPASPLRTVTVCVLASSSCSDVADAVRVMTVLLNATSQFPILVKVINTGPQGVVGLRELLPLAPSCMVALGPGRARVNLVLSPVLSYYQVPQLTYALASTAFDSDARFPLYSRVSASDVDMGIAIASAAQYLAWGRVLIMSTDDEYGTAASAVYATAMETKTVLVEKTYLISDVGAQNFNAALIDIRDRAISRVLVVAMSMTDSTFDKFIAAFRNLGLLSTTIFLFSNPICRYLAIRPDLRQIFVSSLCVVPNYNVARMQQAEAGLSVPTVAAAVDATLRQSRIESGCTSRAPTPFASYVYDAMTIVLRAVAANVAGGLAASNSTGWLQSFHNTTTLNGVSGDFVISPTGTRVGVDLLVNVQEPSGAITPLLTYNPAARPSVVALPLTQPIVWLGNTTDIPPASIRVITFIATSTLRDNPGTIVLSVLGFVGTVVVFVLCYRQYNTQLEVERRLNAIVAEQKYKAGGTKTEAPAATV